MFSFIDLEDVAQGFHLERQGLAETGRGAGPIVEVRQAGMVFARHVAVLAGLGPAVGEIGMEIAPVQGGALDRILEFEVGAESMALAAKEGIF